jgi:hypothetical protein
VGHLNNVVGGKVGGAAMVACAQKQSSFFYQQWASFLSRACLGKSSILNSQGNVAMKNTGWFPHR